MEYDYKCQSHGTFIVKKPMKDASRLEVCPICGTQAQRVFSVLPATWGESCWQDYNGKDFSLTHHA